MWCRCARNVDTGTPELREKRRQLVGSADDAPPKSVLAVLLSRNLIEEDQFEAGERYIRLFYSSAHPPTGFAVTAIAEPTSDGGCRCTPPEMIGSPAARLAFSNARQAVRLQSGTRSATILDKVTIFEEAPANTSDIWNLRAALDALRRHFGINASEIKSTHHGPAVVAHVQWTAAINHRT